MKAQIINQEFDSVLAKTYEADEYGMKNYIFVILKTGKNQTLSKLKRDSLFTGHLKNIQRLAHIGKLVVAGPFTGNNKTYRGIFILNAATIDEANELLQSDPAIKEMLLEAELYKWYGAAALKEYLNIQEKIEKYRFTE